MTRLPRLSGKQMVRALQRGGFLVCHVRGSHFYLRGPRAKKLVTVPVHGSKILPAGTLRSILRQAELSAPDLTALLKS